MDRKKPAGDGTRAGEALRQYRAVLDSGDAFAIHDLGVLAHRQGRSDIAAEAIAKAIALNGQVPSFHYNLALALKASGRLEDAAAAYERTLALKPDHAEAHNNLGNILAAQGRQEQAMDSFKRALALKPDFVQAHYSLANLLCDLGQGNAAAVHFRACLEQDPRDPLGVTLLLARLGAGTAPSRAPAAQLEDIYAKRAFTWDREVQYRGHQLVAQALRNCAMPAGLDILDAGCGTGLVGPLVRDLAARLDGVDLSAAMLARAAEKSVYDRLHQEEMVGFMAQSARSYDAIVSAATLIHFGDLAPVFEAAAAGLRDGGRFVFTVFPRQDDHQDDYAVAQNAELAKAGCYVHAPDYVIRKTKAAGFAVDSLESQIHEHDLGGAPVSALVVVLRRAGA